jgi:hypothetical protein
MMNSKIKFSVLLCALSCIFACAQKEEVKETDGEALSSSLVNSPVTASGDTASRPQALLVFTADTFHFGKINEGEKVTHEFEFTNKGNAPLLITAADASCGCTVAEYPQKPLDPGKGGTIKVVFNSEGKQGVQHKSVTIISNTIPPTKILSFTGEVVKK